MIIAKGRDRNAVVGTEKIHKSVMSDVLALYGKNIFIILTAPFVYTVLEDFGWAIRGVPTYRLVIRPGRACKQSVCVRKRGVK